MPGVANVRDAVVAVPSLKSSVASPSVSHAWLAIVPSGSVELDVNVMLWPLDGAAGVKVNDAVGPRLLTVTVRVLTCDAPLLSVTRRRTM